MPRTAAVRDRHTDGALPCRTASLCGQVEFQIRVESPRRGRVNESSVGTIRDP